MVKQSKSKRELFPLLNDVVVETFGPKKNSSLKPAQINSILAALLLLYLFLLIFFLNKATAASYVSILF